jgi:S-adenosylmethionine:tRNA-ribosyltransferase-isomerase (queuine synthetase)
MKSKESNLLKLLHVGLGHSILLRLKTCQTKWTLGIKITQAACDIVNDAKVHKKRICTVGTTSMRAVESFSSHGTLNPFDGWTNKFVFPPHEFTIPTCMITNFHTPKSTLMMVSAFCGHDLMKRAYEEAIKKSINSILMVMPC